MFDDDLRTEDMERYHDLKGSKQYELILKALGKGNMFVQCLETEIGEQLLKETVEELAHLLEQIIENPDCDDKIKVKYRILRGIARRWAARINKYYGLVNKIKATRS